MNAVIPQILPLAVAVALSTVPIVAALLILLSPARPLVSLALLLGWSTGIGLVLGVLTIGFRLVPESSPARDELAVGLIRIALGAALIAYSLLRWRRRAMRPVQEEPAWMRAIGRIGAAGALGFGFALALRPKNLILSLAAAVIIGDASLSVADGVLVIAIFTAIGISTVAAPIVARFAAPEKSRTPLNASRDWVVRNNALMMLLVVILTGCIIMASGIARLFTVLTTAV